MWIKNVNKYGKRDDDDNGRERAHMSTTRFRQNEPNRTVSVVWPRYTGLRKKMSMAGYGYTHTGKKSEQHACGGGWEVPCQWLTSITVLAIMVVWLLVLVSLHFSWSGPDAHDVTPTSPCFTVSVCVCTHTIARRGVCFKIQCAHEDSSGFGIWAPQQRFPVSHTPDNRCPYVRVSFPTIPRAHVTSILVLRLII